MIPDPDQLETIAKLKEGDLSEVPFGVLLHVQACEERTVVLLIERPPLKKQIIIEKGVPVDCRSNLLHETLGRFMVESGDITDEQAQNALSRATLSGMQFGEALILEGLVSAQKLYRVLQQNLARKLLDGFALQRGHFRLLTEVPKVESPLQVKVPQLVVTGISKLAPQSEVNEAIGVLVGKELFLHPRPPYALNEIRLSEDQKRLVFMLHRGRRIDQLAAETAIPFDDITRLLYSLAVIGIVAPREWLPEGPPTVAPEPPEAASSAPAAPAAPEPVPVPAPARPAPAPTALGAAEKEKLRNAFMEVYLKHRRQDSFELLGLHDTSLMVEIERRYLEFCETYGPWRYRAMGLQSLAPKAEDLILAAGRAFGELSDRDKRNHLIQRRQVLLEERRKKPKADRFAIKSNLLDPSLQFKKGKKLMEVGRFREAAVQLQFAYDCDPQSSRFRAELAYCRFLDEPDRQGEQSLSELKEIMRIEPGFGLAVFYAGEINRELGNFEAAEELLQRSIKMMMPDRRPIESLKALHAKAKKRR